MFPTEPGRPRAATFVGTVCLLSLVALSLVAAQQPPPPPPPGAVLRVGGDIKAPRRVKDVTPRFPREARDQGVSGTVILEVIIGTSGRVNTVKVLRSVPPLDAAAVEAVRQWEYEPTLLNGVPVAVVMTVTVNFSLGNGGGPVPLASAITVGFLSNPTRLVTVARAALQVHDESPRSISRQLPPTDLPERRSLSPDGRFLSLAQVLPPTGSTAPGAPPVPASLTHLLDVTTGRVVTLGSPTPGLALKAGFSADGRTVVRLVRSPSPGVVTYQAWRVPGGEAVTAGQLDVAELGPFDIAMSPTGDRFAFTTLAAPAGSQTSAAGRIHVVETLTGRRVTTVDTVGRTRALVFASSGREVYWSDEGDRSVKRADASTGLALAPFSNPGDAAAVFALANDGRHLLGLGRADRTLRIWDTSTGALLASLLLAGPTGSLATSQDNQQAAVGLDNRVAIVDISVPAKPRVVTFVDVPGASVVASPVGR